MVVSVEGVRFVVSHKSGSEFRRAKRFSKHEPRFIREFMTLVAECSVVWDVGAAIGTYTLLAAKLGAEKKVVAFEPESRNNSALRKNVDLNDLSNVTIHDFALSDKEGRMRIYSESEVAGIGTHQLKGTRESESEESSVAVYSMDYLVSNDVCPSPGLIKVDIEGHEIRFLRGAVSSMKAHRPTILLEYHPDLVEENGYSFGDLELICEETNYLIERIDEGGELNHSRPHYKLVPC